MTAGHNRAGDLAFMHTVGRDGGEVQRLVHGVDVAVEQDAGVLQAVHELGIGQAFGANSSVDTSDPKRAVLSLL